jgi:hypothetical protein
MNAVIEPFCPLLALTQILANGKGIMRERCFIDLVNLDIGFEHNLSSSRL